MVIYKVSRTSTSESYSRHYSIANARRSHDELVHRGVFGYKIYIWNEQAKKWSKSV
jgi:hypothetical protein